MIEVLRRLHSRGPTSRGVVVDAQGAMLGPECVLVCRTATGYRYLSRDDAKAIQALLGIECDRRDWLFEQCRRIAKALDNGELALAQIYGLHISVSELDDRQLSRIAAKARCIKAGFNPDEPRIPAGQSGGGQWTSDDQSPDEPPDDAGSRGFEAYLVNVGYPLSQEMWEIARRLYRLYRDGGGAIATLRENSSIVA
jgi:hypothetical protein